MSPTIAGIRRRLQRLRGAGPAVPSLQQGWQRGRPRSSHAGTVAHVSAYGPGNAGDTLLPVAVRDVIEAATGPVRWRSVHVRDPVNRRVAGRLQHADGILVGGGGLFLADTNPNTVSGWQWAIPADQISRLSTPLALFAVGDNRFRGQPDFPTVFSDHLRLLARHSVFIGLRSRGSIDRLAGYLPEELHDRLVYQPCPTTLLRTLYPHRFAEAARGGFIAVNVAVDRARFRYGDRFGHALQDLAAAVAVLAQDMPVRYYAHMAGDEAFLPFMDAAGRPLDVVRLYGTSPAAIVDAYQRPDLVIGMRGHAQLIPFGCGTPILSVISHDKLGWFLHDIGRPDWGVEIATPDLRDRVVTLARTLLQDPATVRGALARAQADLWTLTRRNVETLCDAFGLQGTRDP